MDATCETDQAADQLGGDFHGMEDVEPPPPCTSLPAWTLTALGDHTQSISLHAARSILASVDIGSCQPQTPFDGVRAFIGHV